MSFLKLNIKNTMQILLFVYVKWILLLLFIIYLFSGFYKIERSEVGVITRFGKIINKRVMPGLHYKLPFPIDKLYKVPIKQVETIEINDFGTNYWNEEGRAANFFRLTGLDPYCITGDNNIIAISILIKYTISEPEKYLFGTFNPAKIVKTVSPSIILKSIATKKVDNVLTISQGLIRREIKIELQKILNKLNSGISISFVEIKKISPPPDIQPFFDQVINAKSDTLKRINEAKGYASKETALARAYKDTITQQAKSFKQNKILHSQGVVSSFLSKLSEYKKSPKITRKNIYLNFLKSFYPKLKEIRIIDKTGKKKISSYMMFAK